MFHASPQREGELDMPKDSGDVTALQLLDTSRRFKAKRKGENSHSLIEASARGIAARFNDLDD